VLALRSASVPITLSRHNDGLSSMGNDHLKLGFKLLSAGMFKDTFDTLRTVDVKVLHDTSAVDYYRLQARAYADVMIFNNHDYFLDVYRRYYRDYLDSALQRCTHGSYQYYQISILKDLHLQHYDRVIQTSDSLIARHRLSYPQAAVFHYDLGDA